MKYKFRLLLTMAVLLTAPLARAQVVSTTADAGAGSLRAAVAPAVNNATITFAVELSGQSIQLDSTLVVNQNLTIDASALPASIRILGNGSTSGAYSVEFTTNLVDWLPLGPAIPRYNFTDTNAPALPQRYYRLRWP